MAKNQIQKINDRSVSISAQKSVDREGLAINWFKYGDLWWPRADRAGKRFWRETLPSSGQWSQ